MKNKFTSYEIAKLVKDKNFTEDCLATFFNGELEYKNCVGFVINKDGINNIITAPLYQQVVDWLYEKHKIRITQEHQNITGMWFSNVWKFDGQRWERLTMVKSFQNLYEALEESIKIALKLI